MPCPFISVICFREEGMIQSFQRSHAKKPESGLFSDWIGKDTDDLRCSDWPKCYHPLVCLHNEQWIHTRVRYEISAGSVFLNLKNVLIEIPAIEIFSISLYTKKLQSKIYRSLECKLIPATSYRSVKWVHFSNNQFMNGILTWFDCNSSFGNLRNILSDLSVREIWCFKRKWKERDRKWKEGKWKEMERNGRKEKERKKYKKKGVCKTQNRPKTPQNTLRTPQNILEHPPWRALITKQINPGKSSINQYISFICYWKMEIGSDWWIHAT